MIAPEAELRFGFRPLPSQGLDALHTLFRSLANAEALDSYQATFAGPPLPAGDIASAEQRRLLARDLADELELPIGNAVDFWTEARSEEHTSELQSLMRISYAVFCLKKKKHKQEH